MNDPEQHADAVVLQTPPAFVARQTAMALTILPQSPLQIVIDVRWANRTDVHVLLVKVSEKIACNVHAANHGVCRVAFRFKVKFQFRKILARSCMV